MDYDCNETQMYILLYTVYEGFFFPSVSPYMFS